MEFGENYVDARERDASSFPTLGKGKKKKRVRYANDGNRYCAMAVFLSVVWRN